MINLDIHMQVVGLILAILLIYMNTTRKKIGLLTDLSFECLIFSVAVSTIFDIASIYTINMAKMGRMSEGINSFICKTYIVTLTLIAAAIFNYTLTEIYGGALLKRKNLLSFVLLEAITIPAVYVLPIYYYVDAESIYSYGQATDMGVATGFIFLVSTLIIIIKHRKHMDLQRGNAVALFCITMMAAAAFQAINRRYLIASVTIALGSVFVYLKLEDPGSYLNVDTGSFNMIALKKYLDGIFSEGKKVSLVHISFSGHRFLKDIYGEKLYVSLMKSIVEYLEKYNGAMVFNTDEMDFIVVFRTQNDFEGDVYRIRRDLMSLWSVENLNIELSPVIIGIHRDTYEDRDSNFVIGCLRYFAGELREGSDKDFLIIDAARIKEKIRNDHMEEILIDAMDKDRIEAYFQPIFDVRTRKIVALEALARVRDENGEIIDNDKIIPIAERSGMILRLGFRVFEGVCRFLSENDMDTLKLEKIGINLSTAQCMQRTLADDLIDLMKLYGIKGSCFTFEINENAVAMSKDLMMKNIKKLSDFGCEIGMDNFGNKLGDMAAIADMNIAIVKIDRDFIKKCFTGDNGEMFGIGQAMIELIRGMDKRVVAVGIERGEELEILKMVGVNYAQGKYLSEVLDEKSVVETCGIEKAQTAE